MAFQGMLLVIWVRAYTINNLVIKNMKLINTLLLKYSKFCEKVKKLGDEAERREEEKTKKYYLDNYGAYHNADKLNQGEMLEVFWKMLKNDGYDVSNFKGSTSVLEPTKQDTDWDDLGGASFITELEKIFGFSRYDITDEEYDRVKTFGEHADLIIKKAKKKKQNSL
jgi:hypothetical protein